MTTPLRQSVENLVSVIEGTSPDTLLGREGAAFVHASTVPGVEELLALGAPTRRFVVLPTGERDRASRLQQPGRPRPVRSSWTVAIGYRAATPYETAIVMAEDEQRLADRLADPTLHDDTPVIERGVEAAIHTPASPGAAGLLTLTVRFEYQPTYTP